MIAGSALGFGKRAPDVARAAENQASSIETQKARQARDVRRPPRLADRVCLQGQGNNPQLAVASGWAGNYVRGHSTTLPTTRTWRQIPDKSTTKKTIRLAFSLGSLTTDGLRHLLFQQGRPHVAALSKRGHQAENAKHIGATSINDKPMFRYLYQVLEA